MKTVKFLLILVCGLFSVDSAVAMNNLVPSSVAHNCADSENDAAFKRAIIQASKELRADAKKMVLDALDNLESSKKCEMIKLLDSALPSNLVFLIIHYLYHYRHIVGKTIQTPGQVTRLCIYPDGTLLSGELEQVAESESYPVIRQWDVSKQDNQTCLRTLQCPKYLNSRVDKFCVLPNGMIAVSFDGEAWISLYTMKNNVPYKKIYAGGVKVKELRAFSDNTLLCVTSLPYNTYRLDPSKVDKWTVGESDYIPHTLEVLPDDTVVSMVLPVGKIDFFDWSDPEKICAIDCATSGSFLSPCLSCTLPDGTIVTNSYSFDKEFRCTMRHWNLKVDKKQPVPQKSSHCINSFKHHFVLCCLCALPDGTVVAGTNEDKIVRFCLFEDEENIYIEIFPKNQAANLCAFSDGRFVSSWGQTITVWQPVPSDLEVVYRLYQLRKQSPHVWNNQNIAALLAYNSGFSAHKTGAKADNSIQDKEELPIDVMQQELEQAIVGNNFQDVWTLLKKRNVESRNKDGMTPLLLAVSKENIDQKIIQHLCGLKASLSCKDDSYNTPLHWVAAHGNLNAFNILMREVRDRYRTEPANLKAFINAKNNAIKTAYDVACDNLALAHTNEPLKVRLLNIQQALRPYVADADIHRSEVKKT